MLYVEMLRVGYTHVANSIICTTTKLAHHTRLSPNGERWSGQQALQELKSL